MRELFGDFKEAITKIINFTFNFKENVKDLEVENVRIIYEFLENGELFEARNRLRIILTLWPNNLEAKYLSGFLYLLANKNNESILEFEKLEKYNYKMSKQFINFLKDDKGKILQDVYYQNFSFMMVEIYLENIL